MKVTHTLAAVLMAAATIFTIPVARADTSKGIDAIVRGDFQGADREFRTDALKGNPDGLFNLGLMYYKGHTGAGNKVIAFALVTAAMHAGHPDADVARNGIGSELTPEQAQEGREIGEAWKKGDPLPSKAKTWPDQAGS